MDGAAMAINVTPMSPTLGGSVTGVDLSNPVDEATTRAIRDAFARHMVLCFPGQDIDEDDHARFCAIFGRADSAAVPKDEKGAGAMRKRGIMWITNIRENGKAIGSLPDGEMQFHSDGQHRQVPYRCTTLYAIKVPSRGGETRFANLYAAYETLPQDIKHRLEGKNVRFVYAVDSVHRDETDENDENLSNAVHPIVRTHAETGRKSLYLSRLMSRYIIGMDRKESDELLAYLFDHAERPEFIYAHRWTPGDLLIWDNRCVNHARNDFPSEEVRLLRRMTVSEDA
jgi:alpha-ketoglutarate-dependent taurine dioxygenase